ncbi:MAG: hypothetical protein RAP70_08750 [Candidatus Celaenobacter antarcticus]|nr:hypothetical protein [Candidatus Celaenobacter antarcticus]
MRRVKSREIRLLPTNRDMPRQVEIKIYNIKGQLVLELPFCASSLSRFLEVAWNGRDGKGRKVRGGVYFYRIEWSGEVGVRKVVFIKEE